MPKSAVGMIAGNMRFVKQIQGSGHLKAYLENVEIYLFNGICKVLVSFLGSERKVATTVHEPRDAESNAKAFRTLRVPTNNKHFEHINGNLLRTRSASFTGDPGVRDLLGRHLHEQLLVTGVREFWTVGVFSTFSQTPKTFPVTFSTKKNKISSFAYFIKKIDFDIPLR